MFGDVPLIRVITPAAEQRARVTVACGAGSVLAGSFALWFGTFRQNASASPREGNFLHFLLVRRLLRVLWDSALFKAVASGEARTEPQVPLSMQKS
jgi:hypothetical protein